MAREAQISGSPGQRRMSKRIYDDDVFTPDMQEELSKMSPQELEKIAQAGTIVSGRRGLSSGITGGRSAATSAKIMEVGQGARDLLGPGVTQEIQQTGKRGWDPRGARGLLPQESRLIGNAPTPNREGRTLETLDTEGEPGEAGSFGDPAAEHALANIDPSAALSAAMGYGLDMVTGGVAGPMGLIGAMTDTLAPDEVTTADRAMGLLTNPLGTITDIAIDKAADYVRGLTMDYDEGLDPADPKDPQDVAGVGPGMFAGTDLARDFSAAEVAQRTATDINLQTTRDLQAEREFKAHQDPTLSGQMGSPAETYAAQHSKTPQEYKSTLAELQAKQDYKANRQKQALMDALGLTPSAPADTPSRSPEEVEASLEYAAQTANVSGAIDPKDEVETMGTEFEPSGRGGESGGSSSSGATGPAGSGTGSMGGPGTKGGGSSGFGDYGGEESSVAHKGGLITDKDDKPNEELTYKVLEGEYVLPKEAVEMIGLPRLEWIRQMSLMQRRKK